jgi:hypothetical protein
VKITIEFEDGREVTLTDVKSVMVAQEHRIVAPSERCPICKFGRVDDGYCTCALGRDLKRVETRRAPNPAVSESLRPAVQSTVKHSGITSGSQGVQE